MGKKITIDSATLMNKAARGDRAIRLFGLEPEQIKSDYSPRIVIHSFVEFKDGSVLAGAVSPPDMQLPIQYPAAYPERLTGPARRLNWRELAPWHFRAAGSRVVSGDPSWVSEVARQGRTCGGAERQ